MFNSLVVWTTNDCNLRCKYCYAEAGKNKDYLSFETFKNAMEYVDKNKLSIQFAGGEPLLNFELIRKIHNYLKENRIKASLNIQSNGSLISQELARELKDMNINVGISLDGPPIINEETRGKTIDSLEGIKNLGRENIIVNLNSVITDETVDYLEELVDLSFYLGNVYGIGLDLLRETGNYNLNKDFIRPASEEKLEKNIKKAYDKTRFYKEVANKKIVLRPIEDGRHLMKNKFCSKAYCYAVEAKSAVLLTNGDLYTCGSLVGLEDYFMGNVNDGNISPKPLKLEVDKKCSLCKYDDYCNGVCPSRLLINNKNSISDSLDCKLKKIVFKILEEE